jgi:hypothetical protein
MSKSSKPRLVDGLNENASKFSKRSDEDEGIPDPSEFVSDAFDASELSVVPEDVGFFVNVISVFVKKREV